MSAQKVTIYGVFDENGTCLYVGCTKNFDKRSASHHSRFKNCISRVLKEVSAADWMNVT